MTTSTESHTEVTGQARQATEESLKASKNLSQKLTGHKLPSVDLTRPVGRFFAPVQKGVDLNRNLATQGAGLVANVLRHLLEQTQRVRSIVKEQAEPAADLGNAQPEREAAEREAAEATLEEAKRKLEGAKRKREEAKRKREEAKQKREEAKQKREQAEREQAEREQAEREQAERDQA